MNIQDLLAILFPVAEKKVLTTDQQHIIDHANGPGWVLAGPGSGKTEVLAVLVLRLLYVVNDPRQKERVSPEAIVVTTFTEKAARNLIDRISQYRLKVVRAHPDLGGIDTSKLRIGTLHGLCNDLLQEFRAPNYQNIRLMDEFEQALFVREHMSLIKDRNPPAEMDFWKEFPWMFRPQEWQTKWSYPPNRWNSTHALVILLNRLVEDQVSIADLRGAGGQLKVLANLYNEYVDHLNNNFRCDFAHLQARFLEFLRMPLGKAFMVGDGTFHNSGIEWVLVDEYQDTNPVQEAIYFELTKREPHNLVVVGDDDQAMYRFRGGSVECMVTFDDACQVFFGIPKPSVSSYPLVDNFRSHPDIVTFFDDYINAFPVMNKAGSRAPKPPIRAKKDIAQDYPPVGRITGKNIDELATNFAKMIHNLVISGVVNSPGECCLLLKSTKESPRNAGKYVEALRKEGLLVYNPRNKSFSEQEEVVGLLGALLAIVDPERRFAQDSNNSFAIPEGEEGIRNAFEKLKAANPELDNYINRCEIAMRSKIGESLDANLQELAYYVLSLEPFSTWQQESVKRVRLGKLTKLLEAYSSMPVLDPKTGKPRTVKSKKSGKEIRLVSRGYIKTSSDNPGEAHASWLSGFYHLFLGYVLNAGFNDEEEDDLIVPPGMVPVMTMHQSKGLEFPFVFVGHISEKAKVSATHQLETLFSAYPSNEARMFNRAPAEDRAEMDLIRQYYVAYSRAEYALILLGTKQQYSKKSIPLGPERNWVPLRMDVL